MHRQARGYYRSFANPFQLLDGHHSRMMLPFLKYINEPLPQVALLLLSAICYPHMAGG
jgi:hypothetical protein